MVQTVFLETCGPLVAVVVEPPVHPVLSLPRMGVAAVVVVNTMGD
jgi:hypothetical protein